MKESKEKMQVDSLIDEESMGEKAHKKNNPTTTNDNVYKDFINTMITFNKGGNWKRITAPERSLEGKKYDCGGNCYLNLHGITGDFPPFYTVESSVGIILANGNVGKYLTHNYDEISTFLSRDGGVSWFEVDYILT